VDTAELVAFAQPLLLKEAIDAHLVPALLPGLDRVALLYLAAVLGAYLTEAAYSLALSWGGERTILRLRKALYGHALSLAQRFFDRQPAGKLLTRVTNDVEALGESIASGVVSIVLDLLLFEDLPAAVGAAPLTIDMAAPADEMERLASRVMAAFAAVEAAQIELLGRAADALSAAFGLPRGLPALRQALAAQGAGARATLERTATDPLHPDAGLRRFLIAASDALGEDRPWLEALLMIAVDRPVDTWRDADEQGLSYRLAALARRYRSLAAFSNAEAPADGRVARRIAFSAPDGEEFATMVWIDEARREAMDALVRETLATGSLAGNQQLQEAFVATLIERVFQLESPPRE
jgi:hypothetical protein